MGPANTQPVLNCNTKIHKRVTVLNIDIILSEMKNNLKFNVFIIRNTYKFWTKLKIKINHILGHIKIRKSEEQSPGTECLTIAIVVHIKAIYLRYAPMLRSLLT